MGRATRLCLTQLGSHPAVPPQSQRGDTRQLETRVLAQRVVGRLPGCRGGQRAAKCGVQRRAGQSTRLEGGGGGASARTELCKAQCCSTRPAIVVRAKHRAAQRQQQRGRSLGGSRATSTTSSGWLAAATACSTAAMLRRQSPHQSAAGRQVVELWADASGAAGAAGPWHSSVVKPHRSGGAGAQAGERTGTAPSCSPPVRGMVVLHP